MPKFLVSSSSTICFSPSDLISLACKTKVAISSIERLGPSNPLSAYQYSGEATYMCKKLEDSQLQEHKQVKIPTHIHVPEIEQIKLIFGTFDSTYFSSYRCHHRGTICKEPLSGQWWVPNSCRVRVLGAAVQTKEVFIFIVEFRSGGAFYLEDLVCRNGDLDLPELSVVMVDDDGGRKKKGVLIDKGIDSSSSQEIKNIKEASSLVSIVINITPASVETIKTCGQTIRSIKVQMPTSLVSSSSTVCFTPSDLVLIPYDEHFSVPGVELLTILIYHSCNIRPAKHIKLLVLEKISLACKTKVAISSIEPLGPSNPLPADQYSGEATDVCKKLEDSQLQEHKQVIIPTHIHVPEIEQIKLILGTFDPRFLLTSQVVDVTTEEQSARAEFNESRNECTMPIDVVTDKSNPVFEQP
ncbi:hypothetical protein ACFE04_001312 [Oxalis oulophora]